ncbi:uncharacterized protein LOC111248035 isoform X3 [Varroa destructor]|uniref:Uncharacterized protein n=1 Tax=Varroa destructor TaxID=109461 RepID=A0A7M7JQ16_VARDE|nr:uncharacterized protein LOC111248035 isoform X3 [Varroa destructor]
MRQRCVSNEVSLLLATIPTWADRACCRGHRICLSELVKVFRQDTPLHYDNGVQALCPVGNILHSHQSAARIPKDMRPKGLCLFSMKKSSI